MLSAQTHRSARPTACTGAQPASAGSFFRPTPQTSMMTPSQSDASSSGRVQPVQMNQRQACLPVAQALLQDSYAFGPLPPKDAPKPQYYVREAEQWPNIPLPQHDLQQVQYVDLIVAGAGPSGVAVAHRVAQAGFSVVVVDPEPLAHWPNNYGVWVDEFQAMGLEECLHVVWPKACVWLGNSPDGQK